MQWLHIQESIVQYKKDYDTDFRVLGGTFDGCGG